MLSKSAWPGNHSCLWPQSDVREKAPCWTAWGILHFGTINLIGQSSRNQLTQLDAEATSGIQREAREPGPAARPSHSERFSIGESVQFSVGIDTQRPQGLVPEFMDFVARMSLRKVPCWSPQGMGRASAPVRSDDRAASPVGRMRGKLAAATSSTTCVSGVQSPQMRPGVWRGTSVSRCTWTLARSPKAIIRVNIAVPPNDIRGSGRPTTGISPVTMAMLEKT